MSLIVANSKYGHETQEVKASKRALKQAIEKAGSKSALAQALGITPQAIDHWLNSYKEIPAKRAAQIEKLLGISKKILCPSFPWD